MSGSPITPPSSDPGEEETPPLPVPAGLTDLMAGRRWMRQHTGQSGSGVYRLLHPEAPDLYLKQAVGPAVASLAEEMTRFHWLAGQRVMVPEVLAFLSVGETAWLVTTALLGRTAHDCLCEADTATRRDIVTEIARFLRSFHELPVDDCPFNSGHAMWLSHARQRMADGDVDTGAFDEEHAGWPPFQVWQKMMTLLPMTVDPVVVHGDFTLDNVLMVDGRVTGCVDVGRAGTADRYHDIAPLWNTLRPFGRDLQAAFLHDYRILRPDDRKLRFHLCLDEFF